MQKVLHLTTTVLPGGKIEITDEELRDGESVDVVVMASEESSGQSAVDVLAEAHGHRVFKCAEDVESYLRAERASWDR